MIFFILFLTSLQLSAANHHIRRASCSMKLNGKDKVIGKVTFSEHNNIQTIHAHLHERDEIVPGLHGLHIHTDGVTDNDCASSGGHFNPDGNKHGELGLDADLRHVGDFGNVEAGERGEINFKAVITVDPEGNAASEKMPKEDIHCRRKYYCTRKKENMGMCSRKPHCYQAMTETYHYTIHSPRFNLKGKNSVVGRAVVLHAGEDDLGLGGDEGSRKTGNAGERVACCTLELD